MMLLPRLCVLYIVKSLESCQGLWYLFDCSNTSMAHVLVEWLNLYGNTNRDNTVSSDMVGGDLQ